MSSFRFKGFLQVYQLQTENDEEETWRDLVCYFGVFFSIKTDVVSSQSMDLIILYLLSARREA